MATQGDDTVTQAYTYDSYGNVSSSTYRHITEIQYNVLTNLPVLLKGEAQEENVLIYNTLNQRVLSKKSNGPDTLYVHGLHDMPLFEVEDSVVQYIYGVGGLLVMIKDTKNHYILKDHQGSVRVVVNETGTVETMMDYLPLGERMPDGYGNPHIISYRFSGYEYETQWGLYHCNARLYDPVLGRFYSIDPRFQYGSPYMYCGNNPVNLTDPSGELASIIVILLIGAAVGAIMGAAGSAFTGHKAGLKGWNLVGYIAAGAGIGAVAGALSSAGGVGAFAVGSAAAAGIAAGAATGAVIGAGIGAAQGVSQHFINDAFGVQNNGSWGESMYKGAAMGASGGAFSGGAAGAGGAIAVQQSLAFERVLGNTSLSYSYRSLTQVSEAYSTFGKFGVIPLPGFVSRIPNINIPLIGGLQTFVLGKFSLPTISSALAALAKQVAEQGFPSAPDTGNPKASVENTRRDNDHYGQSAYNPAMKGSVGAQLALLFNPSYWENEKKE